MLVTRARDNSALPRLLQRGRRPGRAALRRPFGRARRRGRGARARTGLRGGAARRRRRSRARRSDAGSATSAAARWPRERGRSRPDRRGRARRTRRANTKSRAGDVVALRSTSSSRCARRSSSALRDYVGKNGFDDVVARRLGRHRLGRHGGARGRRARAGARALRLDAVALLVRGHARDARRVAESLGCDFRELADRADRRRVRHDARRSFADRAGLAEENLQARVRGVTPDGALEQVRLARRSRPGNKSELSVGYATLYGDMAGGFALLKDVYKTDVFRLARYLNERAGRELIPQLDHRPAHRAPSCAPTSATRTRCRPTPSSTGCSRRTSSSTARARSCSPTASTATSVERALALIDRAEYKRRQAPPGVKLRPKAFGRDRRTPITNRWRGLTGQLA